MQKIVRLLVVTTVLGFASWSSGASAGGHPICTELHDTYCDGGRRVCDNSNGIGAGACACLGDSWDCIYYYG